MEIGPIPIIYSASNQDYLLQMVQNLTKTGLRIAVLRRCLQKSVMSGRSARRTERRTRSVHIVH